MPGLEFKASYLLEYQVDSEGNRICNSLGPEPTPASRTSRRHKNAFHSKDSEVFDRIPPNLLVRPKKPHCHPRIFHFGFAVTSVQLFDYALRRKLVPAEYRGHGRLLGDTILVAIAELDRVSGVKLSLESVKHADYDWVLTRYTNYNWYYEELHDREEEEITDFMRRELDIQDAPRWYRSTISF